MKRLVGTDLLEREVGPVAREASKGVRTQRDNTATANADRKSTTWVLVAWVEVVVPVWVLLEGRDVRWALGWELMLAQADVDFAAV